MYTCIFELRDFSLFLFRVFISLRGPTVLFFLSILFHPIPEHTHSGGCLVSPALAHQGSSLRLSCVSFRYVFAGLVLYPDAVKGAV